MALTVTSETRLAWNVVEKIAMIAAREVPGIEDVEAVLAHHPGRPPSSPPWTGRPPFSLSLYATTCSEAALDAIQAAVSDRVWSALHLTAGAAPVRVEIVILGLLPHLDGAPFQPPAPDR